MILITWANYNLGCATAQAVALNSSLWTSRFSQIIVHMGFKADKVTLGGFLSKHFSSPLPIVIPTMLPYSYHQGLVQISPFGATVPRDSVPPNSYSFKKERKSVSFSIIVLFLLQCFSYYILWYCWGQKITHPRWRMDISACKHIMNYWPSLASWFIKNVKQI